MDFEERARKAHRRGQLVRAAVLLAEGLKRHPGREDALDFLTNLFANELQSPGLEQDLVDALDAQDDRRERIEFILERYAERDKRTMGRELARAASERFGTFEWPPPPTVVREPNAADSDLEKPDLSVGSTPGTSDSLPDDSLEAAQDSEPSDAEAPAVDDGGDDQALHHDEEAPSDVEDDSRETKREAQLRDVQAELSSDEMARASVIEDSVEEPPVSEEPEVSAESESAKAGSDTSNDAAQKTSQDASTSIRAVVALIAVVLLAGGSYVAWQYWGQAQPDDAPSTDVRQIESLDTSERETFPDALGTDAAKIGEQAAFAAAAYAVDWGESLAEPVEASGRLGLAYQAVYHVQNDDFESAIADVTRLEQRFPGELPSLWARGVLDESRGQLSSAQKAYARGAKAFPEFVPFVTGQIRVRVAQGRVSSADSLFERLAEQSPEHPYRYLNDVRWPTRATLYSNEAKEAPSREQWPGSEARLPAVVSASVELDSAVGATERAKRLTHATDAVRLEPALAPAQLLLGVLKAADLDVAAAEEAFAKAAAVDGVSREFSWLLQAAAQQSLAAAGRPDRGLRFAVPFEVSSADAESKAAEWIPDSLADPVPPGRTVDSDLAVEALALRALLLADLGLLATADAQLEAARSAVSSDTVLKLVEVRLRILEGKRNSAIRARRQMSDGPYRQLALAAVSFHDGDYRVAIDAAKEAIDAGVFPHVGTRYAALSLAAVGLVRQALAQLDAWSGGPVTSAEFRAVRMRVLSRVDADSTEVADAYDALEKVEPRGVSRHVDLAGTDFWRKRYDRAARHLKLAEELAPDYPEMNWFLSLVARSSESVGDVQAYLSDSWRSQSGDASLLLELAQIQLDLERFSQARQLFYRALLADRTSIEAIRGMGRAYMGYDVSRGRRDMAGLVDNYGTDSRSLAPKAELYRWLAVLEGVRKGSENGYSYLQKAVELVGETPPLLVERARYAEAKGRVDEARRSYARALERNSSFASAHLGLARTALESGDSSVARTHLERYLDLSGTEEDSAWARSKLDELDADARSDQE